MSNKEKKERFDECLKAINENVVGLIQMKQFLLKTSNNKDWDQSVCDEFHSIIGNIYYWSDVFSSSTSSYQRHSAKTIMKKMFNAKIGDELPF